jgi:hypothetical protein
MKCQEFQSDFLRSTLIYLTHSRYYSLPANLQKKELTHSAINFNLQLFTQKSICSKFSVDFRENPFFFPRKFAIYLNFLEKKSPWQFSKNRDLLAWKTNLFFSGLWRKFNARFWREMENLNIQFHILNSIIIWLSDENSNTAVGHFNKIYN